MGYWRPLQRNALVIDSTDFALPKTRQAFRMKLHASCKRGWANRRRWLILAVAAAVIALPGCHKSGPATGGPASGQTTFASPQDAAKALVEAAKSDDQQRMLAMFGPDSKDVIFSGNPSEDRSSFEQFSSA